MPWTVILENENKIPLFTIGNEFDIDIKILGDLKLLCYLDAYGDTVFNRLQIDDVINDLKSIESAHKNYFDIIQLAQRCKNEPHTYLTFCGD